MAHPPLQLSVKNSKTHSTRLKNKKMVKLISNYRLLLVATHELGHALGIGHSEKPEALMAPSHDEWKGDVKLSKDDIQAIQVKLF